MWRILDINDLFKNSYFIRIQNNTWVNHKDSSDLTVNQVANYGVDSFFQFVAQVGKEIVLNLKSYLNTVINFPYLKLNSSYLILGNCLHNNFNCDLSSIVWDGFSYRGSWTYIYPGWSSLF